MSNINPSKIIYSINFEDVQTVAEEQYGRPLTVAELKIIEDKIGDSFGWYDAIDSCISDCLDIKHTDKDPD
jgi:hypothetical protein